MSNLCWTVKVSLSFVRETEASCTRKGRTIYLHEQESSGVEMKGWELTEDQGEGLGREIK